MDLNSVAEHHQSLMIGCWDVSSRVKNYKIIDTIHIQWNSAQRKNTKSANEMDVIELKNSWFEVPNVSCQMLLQKEVLISKSYCELSERISSNAQLDQFPLETFINNNTYIFFLQFSSYPPLMSPHLKQLQIVCELQCKK